MMLSFDTHLRKRGITKYCVDGAIDPTTWRCTPLKILFLLKETWGYQGCETFHVGQQAPRWLNDKKRAISKSVLLAAVLTKAVGYNRPLSPTEIETLKADKTALRTTLDTIAWINLKKHSGNKRSDDAVIRSEGRENAPILREQIIELDPHVIIAGGVPSWACLTEDLGLFDTAVDWFRFGAIVRDGKILCRGNHPAAWAGGGFNVHQLHNAIFSVYRHAHPTP